MPKTELQLQGIERKFKLNDAIYTFLLQKRSEAQIARASSMPDYETIEPARLAAAIIVSPKKKFNYILALLRKLKNTRIIPYWGKYSIISEKITLLYLNILILLLPNLSVR